MHIVCANNIASGPLPLISLRACLPRSQGNGTIDGHEMAHMVSGWEVYASVGGIKRGEQLCLPQPYLLVSEVPATNLNLCIPHNKPNMPFRQIMQKGWLDGAEDPHTTVTKAILAVDQNKVHKPLFFQRISPMCTLIIFFLTTMN